MFQRLFFALTLLVAAPSLATAQDFEDYTPESFEAALETGKPIVVNFYESWCPRCTTQRRNLSALIATEPYSDFIVLEAVHGEHRAFAASMGITARTSLALIVDRALVGIEVGGTSTKRVKALLDQAL